MPAKYKGGTIKCSKCPSTFKIPCHYKSHMSTVHGPPKFECEICGKKFKKNHPKNVHMATFHLKELSYKCHCGSSFGLKASLQRHINAMHKPQEERKKFTCPACHKEFLRNDYCQKHFNNVHLGQGLQCPHEGCNFSAATTSNLKMHLISHSLERPFACGHCSLTFKQNDTLTKHVKKVHTAPVLPIQRFVCHHCPKSFRTINRRNSHALIHRDIEARQKFSCSICEKSFLSKQNYRAHVKSHGQEKGEPIKCEIIGCNRKYANVASFKFHVKKFHENSINIQCYFCFKIISCNVHLYKHIRRYHLFERIYRCDTQDCGKAFLSLRSLETHKKYAHETNWKSFSCNSCEKCFSEKPTLNKHVKAFHGERPAHQCSFCKMAFMTKSRLENHVRARHTMEKPFSCKNCNYQASNLGYLRAHRSRMH